MSAELIAIGVIIASLSFVFGVYIGLGAKEWAEDGKEF